MGVFDPMDENDDKTVLVSRTITPSAENMPSTAQSIGTDLYYYPLEDAPQTTVVLRPMSLSLWDQEELDETFAQILAMNPEVLVVDLKDTPGRPGGTMDHVVHLSRQLGVNEPFELKFDAIGDVGGMDDWTQGVNSFEHLLNHVPNNPWKGKVVFRINPQTSGEGDFFIRWMKLNDRGLVFGMPTAGTGSKKMQYLLSNTGTAITIPKMAQTFVNDHQAVEGVGTQPDVYFDGGIEVFLDGYWDRVY